jgi:hypothetical protein
MKKSILVFSIFCVILLAGCVTVQFAQPTPLPPAPTIRPQPTSQPPTLQPIFTAIVQPTIQATIPGATRIKIYLIAIEDNGVSGKKIGCNDSLVPVEVQISPTLTVLKAALNELFKLQGQQYYGASGLYNSLYQSSLSTESLNIVNREAIIRLKGNLVLGGVCDDPRAKAQLEEIALQFSTIDRVSVFINGVPLQQLLSGQG